LLLRAESPAQCVSSLLLWPAQAQQKEERRSRGDALTQTSDARFDAGFRVAHGLTGPAPWYARTPAERAASAAEASPSRADSAAGASSPAAHNARKERRGSKCEGDKGKRDSKRSKEKSSGRKRRAGAGADELRPAKKSVEQLRAERLQREAAEAARSRALMRGT